MYLIRSGDDLLISSEVSDSTSASTSLPEGTENALLINNGSNWVSATSGTPRVDQLIVDGSSFTKDMVDSFINANVSIDASNPIMDTDTFGKRSGHGTWAAGEIYSYPDLIVHDYSIYVSTDFVPYEATLADRPTDGENWSSHWLYGGALLKEASRDALLGVSGTPSSSNPVVLEDNAKLAVSPDYCPPAFKSKSADEITIVGGRYYLGGYRLDGQYQDLDGLISYLDVTEFDVDIDGASQIGGDVVSSWYSVFLTAADAVVILPCIRVDALDYNVSNAGKTTINPADHDDGTTANNNFVSANDVFNGYRLLLLSDTAYRGNVYTIDDSVSGTPDEIIIDGDVSAEIANTEWLQMIPASGTSCVYLGAIELDGSGDLYTCPRHGWTYQFSNILSIAVASSTSPANWDIGYHCPPMASFVDITFYADTYTTNGKGPIIYLYPGSTGSDHIYRKWHRTETNATGRLMELHMGRLFLSSVSNVRGKIVCLNTSNVEVTCNGTCYVRISGFEE
jgi:hypothetical protein